MCFLLKVELYQLGAVHCPAMLEMCFLAKAEMYYLERVGSVSKRMLLGFDMEGSQSPGLLAAEALANHEAVSVFFQRSIAEWSLLALGNLRQYAGIEVDLRRLTRPTAPDNVPVPDETC